MAVIINETTKCIELQSHRKQGENWNGEGWIVVPKELEEKVLLYAPFCELVIKEIDGKKVITDVIEKEKESTFVPSIDDRVSALEQAMLSMMGVSSDA